MTLSFLVLLSSGWCTTYGFLLRSQAEAWDKVTGMMGRLRHEVKGQLA